ncbi:MAG: tryptophan synthase subunit alpha [Candidatus Bathyarchaeota archaeon]|nr:tryptophan synthase subunit alpha [Candidatus Bathyarchaeota archaeon]
MNSIKQAFEKLKKQRTAALIAYITAGDPTPEDTVKIAEALIEGGVDIIELGLPFSDPIADGPTIQNASLRALKAGTTPLKVLEIAQEIKNQHDVPVTVMTYYNPVFRFGTEKFLCSAKKHLVDGFIVPDLPVEEADEYRKAAKTCGLDTIFLASPATSEERLKSIIDASSGFLYLVSRFGVTGAQESVQEATVHLIKRIQPYTTDKVPLAVGFGISKPEHVKRVVNAGADAAIVGSAFINIIQNSKDKKETLRNLKTKAEELKAATKTKN